MENYELYHWGIKGMKWGVRRYRNEDGTLTETGKKRYSDDEPEQLGYKSTGLKARRARKANEKVDEGFKRWDESDKHRDNAISLGKKATSAKLAYESDKSNKDAKSAYKQANKEYKKALSENTTYRKGVVRSEVGKDASRKYLSQAKKVKKQLEADPTNKQLQKQYNDLMSKHDIERADARRAREVGEKRSRKKASIKRTLTITATAAAGTAAATAGAIAVNHYLKSHDVQINGKRVRLGAQNFKDLGDLVKKGRNLLGYLY